MRAYKAAILATVGAILCVGNLQAWSIMDWFTSDKNPQVQSIKVLLLDQADSAFLEVGGAYNIYDPRNSGKLGARFVGKAHRIQSIPGGLKWGEEFPGIYQLKISPDDPETSVLVNGVQFHGSVYVYNIDNRISVVNEIDIEDYVAAILASQVDQGLTKETLAAIAVTERTNAYYRALHPKTPYFHVDGSEVNYQGQGVVTRRGDVTWAVNHSRHLIMVNNDGAGPSNTFAAHWTEHSAGKTAPYHIIFRKEGNVTTTGVDSPFAAVDRSGTAWSSSVTRHELARWARMDHVSSVKLSRDALSGKVFNIRLEDGNLVRDFDYLSFSKLMGPDIIKSSEFEARVNGDIVTFSGYGRGHGVGLCVYGALRMEDRGADARQILVSFFPDTHMEAGRRKSENAPVVSGGGGLYHPQRASAMRKAHG